MLVCMKSWQVFKGQKSDGFVDTRRIKRETGRFFCKTGRMEGQEKGGRHIKYLRDVWCS